MLLPLNLWRLVEVKQLIRKVRTGARSGTAATELIVPYMRRTRYRKGAQIFAKSDRADCVYYVLEGAVRLADKNILVPPGQMIGTIGIFSQEHLRTDTAVCASDVELGMISKDKILELFYQHPEFGAFLIRMVAQRAALDYPPHATETELAPAVPKFSRWLP
jgi:CRP-like cAMP-binding protein